MKFGYILANLLVVGRTAGGVTDGALLHFERCFGREVELVLEQSWKDVNFGGAKGATSRQRWSLFPQ